MLTMKRIRRLAFLSIALLSSIMLKSARGDASQLHYELNRSQSRSLVLLNAKDYVRVSRSDHTRTIATHHVARREAPLVVHSEKVPLRPTPAPVHRITASPFWNFPSLSEGRTEDPCAGMDCSGHGFCSSVTANDATCNCNDGFLGARCEERYPCEGVCASGSFPYFGCAPDVPGAYALGCHTTNPNQCYYRQNATDPYPYAGFCTYKVYHNTGEEEEEDSTDWTNNAERSNDDTRRPSLTPTLSVRPSRVPSIEPSSVPSRRHSPTPSSSSSNNPLMALCDGVCHGTSATQFGCRADVPGHYALGCHSKDGGCYYRKNETDPYPYEGFCTYKVNDDYVTVSPTTTTSSTVPTPQPSTVPTALPTESSTMPTFRVVVSSSLPTATTSKSSTSTLATAAGFDTDFDARSSNWESKCRLEFPVADNKAGSVTATKEQWLVFQYRLFVAPNTTITMNGNTSMIAEMETRLHAGVSRYFLSCTIEDPFEDRRFSVWSIDSNPPDSLSADTCKEDDELLLPSSNTAISRLDDSRCVVVQASLKFNVYFPPNTRRVVRRGIRRDLYTQRHPNRVLAPQQDHVSFATDADPVVIQAAGEYFTNAMNAEEFNDPEQRGVRQTQFVGFVMEDNNPVHGSTIRNNNEEGGDASANTIALATQQRHNKQQDKTNTVLAGTIAIAVAAVCVLVVIVLVFRSRKRRSDAYLKHIEEHSIYSDTSSSNEDASIAYLVQDDTTLLRDDDDDVGTAQSRTSTERQDVHHCTSAYCEVCRRQQYARQHANDPIFISAPVSSAAVLAALVPLPDLATSSQATMTGMSGHHRLQHDPRPHYRRSILEDYRSYSTPDSVIL